MVTLSHVPRAPWAFWIIALHVQNHKGPRASRGGGHAKGSEFRVAQEVGHGKENVLRSGGAHRCRVPVAQRAALNAWQEWRDPFPPFRNTTESLGSGSRQFSCAEFLHGDACLGKSHSLVRR